MKFNNSINVNQENIKVKSKIIFEKKNVDTIFHIIPTNTFIQVNISKIHINLIKVSYSKYENIYHNLQSFQTNYDNYNSELACSISKSRINVYNINNNILKFKIGRHNFDNISNNYDINIQMKNHLLTKKFKLIELIFNLSI